MGDKGDEYLRGEYEFFQKAYEVQFTHFMGVFYFWIAVVTFPATASLFGKDTSMTGQQVGYILGLIAFMGVFLSAKMFDIRCAQLIYSNELNYLRKHLYMKAKGEVPEGYTLRFDPATTNLRRVAFADFGMWMAVAMSLVNGTYAGLFANLVWQSFWISSPLGIATFILNLGLYRWFVRKRVPIPPASPPHTTST